MTAKRLLYVRRQRGVLKDTASGKQAQFLAYIAADGLYTISCPELNVWTARTSPDAVTDSLTGAGLEIVHTEQYMGEM